MKRRDFLKISAVALTGACAPHFQTPTAQRIDQPELADRHFLPILEGFLQNARKTAPDYTVCDYPDGTKLKSCCTPGGKTYVSVARMLPAMAQWQATNPKADLSPILLSIYKNAFDPGNPNFWGYAPDTKPTQLSVEAALVACSLAQLGETFVAQFSPAERTNIQKWLASCTQVPERKTNHAWFTAVNQATRLKLSKRFPEFQGDENWMLEDLKALDALGETSTAEGWYSDSPDQAIYDLYNFYVFPNFPLIWGGIVGEQYPQWNEKFHSRVATFLETTPYFFAGNGSHPLMGRSLIYRWAVLSPLVLGYQQGLWPHSPGLLKRIVRKQLEYHWNLGCFDAERGKLRESYSADGTPAAREPYVDNGHPYWAMLGFSFLSIPKSDPFWTAKEEPLPVERGDYLLRFEGPKFLLKGSKKTGEVRWIQSQNSPKRDIYRDKYAKLVWSSHFAFNASIDKDHVPPDQAVVFRDIATGKSSTRAAAGVAKARLLADGIETTWSAELNSWKFTVITQVQLKGDAEIRMHQITAPADSIGKVEILEGSFAAPSVDKIDLRILQGYDRVETQAFDNINLIHRRVSVRVAIGRLTAQEMTFAVQHSATP